MHIRFENSNVQLVQHDIDNEDAQQIRQSLTEPIEPNTLKRLTRNYRESSLSSFLEHRPKLSEIMQRRPLFEGRIFFSPVTKAFAILPATTLHHALLSFTHSLTPETSTETMVWTRQLHSGVIPAPRNCHTLTAVGDQLFLFGGFGTSYRGSFWVFIN